MSSQAKPRILPCGDTALIVEYGDQIDRHVSALVLALAERIDAAVIDGVVELVPTFRSLMVHYDPLRLSHAELSERIAVLMRGLIARDQAGRRWRLPACYEGELSPDLADVAERTGMTPRQVVECHSTQTYHVYMLGFLPGYPYMGDVPKELQLPRRENPRVKVPAGSLAIAMAMTAVYALESPGGWHLLGRTPVRIWDPRRASPALLAPGDKVSFEPVSLEAYARIAAAVDAGTHLLQPSAEVAA